MIFCFSINNPVYILAALSKLLILTVEGSRGAHLRMKSGTASEVLLLGLPLEGCEARSLKGRLNQFEKLQVERIVSIKSLNVSKFGTPTEF